jgi:hypothetical protein
LNANLLARERDVNVSFHRNLLPSEPGKTGEIGGFIDEMHKEWATDFEALEARHGYIQWLFPMFGGEGMNWRASPLTRAGAAKIRADEHMSRRVVLSYRVMLGFCGLVLADERTGRVERAPDAAHAEQRLRNINVHPHNLKRITRIFISLGQLGFVRYRAPLLHALEREIDAGTLGARAAAASSEYWHPVVFDEDSVAYQELTLEAGADDREEGVLFEGIERPQPPSPPPSQPARVAKRLSRQLSARLSGSSAPEMV